MKRQWELEKIRTLQDAPRDVDKLRKLLKAKQRESEDKMKIEKIERLVTEIEMPRFVLCALCRMQKRKKRAIEKLLL